MKKGEENDNNKSWQDHEQWVGGTGRGIGEKREMSYIYTHTAVEPGSEKAIGLTTGLLPDRRAIIFPIHYPNRVTC